MAKFVVIQHGQGICREMIAISFRRTWEWCKAHGLWYAGCTRRLDPTVCVNWEKLVWWKQVLATLEDGDEGVFIDADTFIVQPDVSPRGVLPESHDLGIRWYTETNKYFPSRFQNGVMFFRKSPRLEKIIADTWDLRHRIENTRYGRECQDEWAMNQVLAGTDLCYNIPKEWNGFFKSDHAVIAHYPGTKHETVLEKLKIHCCQHKRRIKWSA